MRKGSNFRKKASNLGSPSLGSPRRARPANGNAKLSYERFLALAQSAASAGDHVEAENFYQHAEHYFRLMQESASFQQA
jgi:hypothetical protein